MQRVHIGSWDKGLIDLPSPCPLRPLPRPPLCALRPIPPVPLAFFTSLPLTMNTLRTLAAEARWRGLWGTVRAIKMHRLGSKSYLVGEDEAGNRFFNNPALPAGRDRWVEYAEAKNFDAVKIAPEWYVARRVGVVVIRVVLVVGGVTGLQLGQAFLDVVGATRGVGAVG